RRYVFVGGCHRPSRASPADTEGLAPTARSQQSHRPDSHRPCRISRAVGWWVASPPLGESPQISGNLGRNTGGEDVRRTTEESAPTTGLCRIESAHNPQFDPRSPSEFKGARPLYDRWKRCPPKAEVVSSILAGSSNCQQNCEHFEPRVLWQWLATPVRSCHRRR